MMSLALEIARLNDERDAMYVVMQRMREDLYSMQQTLDRVTNERNQWRASYYRTLREKAELTFHMPHDAA